MRPLPNKRLKLAARVHYGNESFFSAPQLKRDPLGSNHAGRFSRSSVRQLSRGS